MKIRFYIIITIFLLLSCQLSTVKGERRAYDLEEAIDICKNLPLQPLEGIWIYPDDNVTVLILADESVKPSSGLDSYIISVIESSDCRLTPGETIGTLSATPQKEIYKIELFTEKNNEFLLKPKSCLASLSKNSDVLILKKSKSKLKGRLNFNFNRLLPGFWKIVSTGISINGSDNSAEAPIGMVKIYPSYDGNGSSRRKIRYL